MNKKSMGIFAALLVASMLLSGCMFNSVDSGNDDDKEKSSSPESSASAAQVSDVTDSGKDKTVMIFGNVTDDTDNILEGYVVNLDGPESMSCSTDRDGFYRFDISGDKTGEYTLSVSREGYADYSERITVGDEKVIKGIYLEKDKDYIGDLEIQYNELSNDDIRPGWKTLKNISGISYPGYNTMNSDLKTYLESVYSKETLLDTLGGLDYETVSGTFDYSFPMEGFLQMRSVLSMSSKGMAHPQPSSSMYFIDLKNRKQLGLCDLFEEDAATVKKEIAKKAYKYMDSSLKSKEVRSLSAGAIYDGMVFYVTGNDLTVEFPPYAIASFSAGFIKCTIPWSDIDLHCVLDGIETAANATPEQSSKEESGKEESGKEQSSKEESSKEQSNKEESSKEESSKEESSKAQSSKE